MGESAREYVRGICTVSAPLDLAACARRIGERDNRVYEARFVRAMRKRLRATGRYQVREFEGLRSVFELDDRFTAPSFGFGDAANYYRTQSAIGYLGGVRVPALLIQAKDDTFVPFAIYQSTAVRSNPWIELMATEHGGHLGFIARGPNRLWSDEAIMEWIAGTIVKKSSYQPSKVLRST
jgi:predicted alpha/beta-fold hydrolase